MKQYARTRPLLAFGALLFFACSSTAPLIPAEDDPDAVSVFSIGDGSLLNFKRDRDAYVVVFGRNLDSPYADVRITATGVVPVRDDEIEVVERSFARIRVKIDKNYFVDARDRQLVTFVVSIAAKDDVAAGASGESTTVALAKTRAARTRRPTKIFRKTLELQSDEAHTEKVAERRISLDEIDATPMPEDAVKEIFGNLVADNYYVVALRIFNRESEARYVTTGLIGARGQIAVLSEADARLPAYQIPAKIQPERLTVVYSHVNDRRTQKAREWIFRSLKFVGALATGLVNAFPADEDAVRGLSVFTGIFIPEGEKLWPDQTEGYLKALVNFGMPDVVKVASGGSSGGVLFFSKKRLHSLATDVTYLGRSGDDVVQPPQFVASLQLDGLDVYFEKVPNEDDERLLKAMRDERTGRAAVSESDSLGAQIASAAANAAAAVKRIEGASGSVTARSTVLLASIDALKAAQVDSVKGAIDEAEKARASIDASAGRTAAVASALATLKDPKGLDELKAAFAAERTKAEALVTDIANEKDAERRGVLRTSAADRVLRMRAYVADLRLLVDVEVEIEVDGKAEKRRLSGLATEIERTWNETKKKLDDAYRALEAAAKAKVPTAGTIWDPSTKSS